MDATVVERLLCDAYAAVEQACSSEVAVVTGLGWESTPVKDTFPVSALPLPLLAPTPAPCAYRTPVAAAVEASRRRAAARRRDGTAAAAADASVGEARTVALAMAAVEEASEEEASSALGSSIARWGEATADARAA